MAAGKEIRAKIKSFENTKKITKAMEMVSASKMRKTQDRMRAARPYGDKIRNITANLAKANPEYRSPFMRKIEGAPKSVGFIVITTDKGLCGGMNTNILRAVTQKMRDVQTAGGKVQAVAIGNKGLGFLNRIGAMVVSQLTQLGDQPHMDKLIGPVMSMLDLFASGQLDAVYLCYTKFVNTMTQEPLVEQLLPLSAERLQQSESERSEYAWDYIYEPEARVVIDALHHPLHRGVSVRGRGREHGQRTGRAHGGHEGRDRQRHRPDRRVQAHLQQAAPGRDHQGIE